MNNIIRSRVLRVLFLIAVLMSVVIYIFGPMITVTDSVTTETFVWNESHTFFRIQNNFNSSFVKLENTNHEEFLNNSFTQLTNSTLCNASSNLGPIPVNKTNVGLSELSVNPIFKNITMGGYYKPHYNCTTDRVAIIVPYRNREEHLSIFLNNIHQFLMKQKLEYGIFIVEQYGQSSFNRGKLMNVGFVESQNLKEGGWDCFIFHDVDLLPTDTANIYSCPNLPRHMSAAVDVFNYKLPYKTIFGGVSAMTAKQFTEVNGFSNEYWGWGGEDDDLYNRIVAANLSIERYDMTIARYIMLTHDKAVPNPKRTLLLKQTKYKFRKDGLSSLHYFVMNMNRYNLFTHIVVDIG